MLFIVAVTGASGGHDVFLLVSDEGKKLIKYEGEDLQKFKDLATRTFSEHDLDSPCSSGSVKTAGMIVVPCSMKTISCIAHGLSDNAITRAADVTLKERRPLILVPRETPLSMVHLRNLLHVAEAGAVVLPAMPAFYSRPRSVDDMVDFVVGKILDLLNIPHTLFKPWGESE
jgi:4-hydroxy-3-polyprenylbenzoate decarboxylase